MTISAYAGPAEESHAPSRANAWRIFVALVSLASLLPFVALPLAQHVIPDTAPALFIVTVLNFLGANFHIASTAWFYTDPEMRSFFRAHPLRYAVVPVALVVGCASAFWFLDRSVSVYLLIPFFSWQLWHYQKQNVGLLSFVVAGTGASPLSVWERRTLTLAAVGGMLGLFHLFNDGVLGLSAQFERLYRFGLAVYTLLPIPFGIALLRTPELRTNALRLSFFLFGTLFFLPTFMFSDWVSAILAYALSHGLQYLVFMGFVCLDRRKIVVSLAPLVMVASGGALIQGLLQAPGWLHSQLGWTLYGASLALVMTHFVVDA